MMNLYKIMNKIKNHTLLIILKNSYNLNKFKMLKD